MPVVAMDEPVKEVIGGNVLDAVSSLAGSDRLSEADAEPDCEPDCVPDCEPDCEPDCVGSAEVPESVAGPDAVGIALSVVTVKVGRSCAATLETPMAVRVARRKRADGDMRHNAVDRIMGDLFNLVSLLEAKAAKQLE